MSIVDAWYQNAFWPKLLLPLSWLYRGISCVRRRYYESRRPKLPIPVIVVGNITVGGTGKTPLVIELVKHLQKQGKRVGVVSRGYGGKGPFPVLVNHQTPVEECGDEPFLIHLKTGVPVCCAPRRLYAAQLLIESGEIDVIVSDDGMQHYALDRTTEICVVDGQRRFGNELCLPAGPLREPVSRLKTVDHVVVNGSAESGEVPMTLVPDALVNLSTGKEKPVSHFKGKKVTAVCGIGNPTRFVKTLESLGYDVSLRAFPDHHAFKEADFNDISGDIVMTEKDAIKCHTFANPNMWVLPVRAEVDFKFLEV